MSNGRASCHLAEANSDLAKQRGDEFGFEKATADWRELIADPEVDVVSVTTPNQFHPEMAIAALEAGKHVWCEKPMAPAYADAERMLSAAKASGKVAILGYNYIQNPVMRHIKALIGEGAIGEVNHVRVEMDEDFMADPEASSSGRASLPAAMARSTISPCIRCRCSGFCSAMSKPLSPTW